MPLPLVVRLFPQLVQQLWSRLQYVQLCSHRCWWRWIPFHWCQQSTSSSQPTTKHYDDSFWNHCPHFGRSNIGSRSRPIRHYLFGSCLSAPTVPFSISPGCCGKSLQRWCQQRSLNEVHHKQRPIRLHCSLVNYCIFAKTHSQITISHVQT